MSTPKGNYGIVFSKRLLVINTASSMAVRLLSVAVLIWMHPYLLNRISLEEYSLLPIVSALMYVAMLLVPMVRSGVARYTVAALATRDSAEISKVTSSALPVSFLLALLVLSVGLLMCANLDSLVTLETAWLQDAQLMLLMLVIAQSVELVVQPLSVGLHATQQFVLQNAIRLGQEALRLTILAGLLLLVDARVMFVVVATSSSSLIGAMLIVSLSLKALPDLRPAWSSFSLAKTKQLVSFGGWSVVNSVSNLLRNSAAPLILNEFGSKADVAAYNLVLIPDRQLGTLINTSFSPSEPALTAAVTNNNHVAIQEAYLRGNRYLLWFTLFVVNPLILFADSILVLYVGERFEFAASALTIIYLTYVFRYSTFMLFRILFAKAELQSISLWTLGVQLCVAAVTFLAVSQVGMGVTGAAASAFTVNVLFQLFVAWPMGCRVAGTKLVDFLTSSFLRGTAPCGVVLVVGFFARDAVILGSWVHLAFIVGVLSFLYLSVVFLVATAADRRDLQGALRLVSMSLRGKTLPR